MLAYYIIIALVIGGLFYLKFRVFNKLDNEKQLNTVKIISLIYALLFAIWFMFGDTVVDTVTSLDDTSGLLSPLGVFANTMFHWFGIASMLIIISSAFFDIKQLKMLLRFFALPISTMLVIFFFTYGLSIGGEDAKPFDVRIMFASLQVALGFVLAFYQNTRIGKLSINRHDIISLLIGIVCVSLTAMPVTAPRALLGLGPTVEALEFSVFHRFLIYLAFIIPTIVYLSLHRKDKDFIKLWLVFISYGTMIGFMKYYTFEDLAPGGEFNVTRLPLHLCNTASLMMPILVSFKLPRVYYFTLFVNVIGAFFAILLPNYSSTISLLSPTLVIYYVNHFVAFAMPFLLLVLGLYEKPTKKHFMYSSYAFAVYFVFILFINAWFSNYGNVDYFFLNSDFIAEKLGEGIENTRDIIWKFNIGDLEFVFYPLYQFIFYVAYVFLSLFMWFTYEYMFKTADSWRDLHDKLYKIKVDELALSIELGGRPLDSPINPEGANMIELKNFSKRYGSSDVFAVKDANFTVNAGEVFGFLGPNGAGKSTIIKSLVGIQPVTEGNIEICGYDIMRQSVEAKLNMGFVPDHYALYEKLTGREYINYIADLYRVTEEDRTERINHFLDIFELKDKFDNKMRTYSHGMKQKIAIIAALIHDPKVWILDEPLTGLDPNSIFQVKETMKLHAERGNIVFFSSHIMDVVERLCDKVAIINQGKILEVSTMEDILKKEDTLEVYYMDKIENCTHKRPTISDTTKKKKESLKGLKKEARSAKAKVTK